MTALRNILAAIVVLPLAACAHNGDLNTRWPVGDQGRQLMSLAAREASRIDDPDRRITRQLNLADIQRERFGATDAIVTLSEARQTLQETADQLKPHVLLSGWVSISQISRRANNPAMAKLACTEAVERLHSLPGGALRCRYVFGVANEVKHLLSGEETTTLLERAGGWAAEIGDTAERRQALQAFAVALFNLGHYDQGVTVLRNDPDAVWRSDALAMLAGGGLSSPRTSPGASLDGVAFGSKLDYEHVFKGQAQSKSD